MSHDNTRGNNNSVNMSDLDSSLPAAAAALSAEDRADLFNEIKDKLDYLTGQHAIVFLESLSPKVRKRVESLIGIQKGHDKLESKYFEEKAALEAKYRKLYEPLYMKRYDIVTGEVEVEVVTNETMENQGDKATEVKGVPDFWLTALKTNELLAGEITERDEGALKYLKDIKWHRLEDTKGFKLEFYFDPNPFFKNSVLTKAYHMIDEEEGVLEKAIGTDIEWCPGKNLTQKILKKKPKKGSKDTKPITKAVDCHSFFNFFKPPRVPDEDDDEIDDNADEELQNLYIQDYDIGYAIKEKIIPHAVYWYTGEAAEDEDEEEEVEEEEDGKDEDNVDDDK